MYERKNASPIVYDYPSLQQLRFEMELRAAVVAAAYELSGSGLHFADFKHARCNEALWTLTPEGGFRIRADATPADGIRDIFANGGQYATECATAAMIVFYKGALDLIGPGEFNRLFSGLLLYDWHTEGNLLLTKSAGPEETYPGDLVYFKNPDFSPDTPQWRGENAIKVEDDLYYGHPFGITSSQAILSHLNRFRRPGSETPAYLTDEVVYPNYPLLSSFALGRGRMIIARIGRYRYTG